MSRPVKLSSPDCSQIVATIGSPVGSADLWHEPTLSAWETLPLETFQLPSDKGHRGKDSVSSSQHSLPLLPSSNVFKDTRRCPACEIPFTREFGKVHSSLFTVIEAQPQLIVGKCFNFCHFAHYFLLQRLRFCCLIHYFILLFSRICFGTHKPNGKQRDVFLTVQAVSPHSH